MFDISFVNRYSIRETEKKMTAFLKKNKTLVVILLFVSCGLFLIWKAHQGYIFNDEPFMVSLGQRLVKGDRFFIDEWNTTQLVGVFYAPVVFLYTTISGGTVGIILFCRLVYVAWWLCVGVVLYRRLRQYGLLSTVAVAFFLLYTPLDEMTLTYNAMGLSLLLLFVSYYLIDGNIVFDYINGIVLALAVLAYPGLLTVYVVYFIAVLVKSIFKIKTDEGISRMLSWKLFLRITAAAVSIAVVFCIFVFSAGLSSIVESLAAMFSTGADDKKDLFLLLEKLFEKMPIMTIGGPLVIAISIFDRNRHRRTSLYMITQVFIFSLTIIYLIYKDIYSFNAIMIPLFFVGLQAFVFVKQRDSVLTLAFGVVGLISSFVWYFSSDTKIPSFSNGFVLINIASLIYLYRLHLESAIDLDKLILKRALPIALCFVLVCVQIGAELYIKVRRSYWDELFPALRTTIQVGAAKNLTTCDYYANRYNVVYDDVLEMRRLTGEDRSQKLLSLSLFPSVFLDMDYEFGTFSSWTFTGNALDFDSLNRKLTKYYEMNPTKVADIIYINNHDRDNIGMITSIDFSQYTEKKLKSGSAFLRNKI